MSNEIPSRDEFEAQMQEMVRQGLMEEVGPGKYKLTAKGEAYAEALIKTPRGKDVIDRLDKAHQRGKRKH